MRRFIFEPLVQFIALGLLLFIANGLWETRVQNAANSIVIDGPTRMRLAAVFSAEQSHEPTDDDMQALILSYVQEQALAREAQRVGLGSDDTIITRRLAQKMRFMLVDNTPPGSPGDTVLREWFRQKHDDYVVPERRAISHIFLSPTQSAVDIDTRAQTALQSVTAAPDSWKSIGDPFMMAREFSAIDTVAMARVFGRKFSEATFELPTQTGVWLGPIESAFGLHLVRINAVKPEQALEFKTVSVDILADWQEAQLSAKNAKRLKSVIERYKVIEK